jgi:CRP-like cAMP-binding protein
MDPYLQLLIDNSTERFVSRNALIVTEGRVDQNIYFIKSGAVRVFLQTEFEEMTIRFGYRNNIITSLSSFINNAPSEFYIQAIRATTLGVITREQFMQFVNAEPARLQWYVKLLEQLVTQQMEREIDLLTASPSARLQRVLERSPQLFQEIPSKYIASYLRMTPETLSRIRK